MPFVFDPHSVTEKKFEVLPEGEYNFETVSAVEGVSQKTGKDMLVLTLNVFDNKGKAWAHKIFIVDSTLYHLKSYWESVGQPEMFEKISSGHDELQYIGKCGTVKTRLETNDGKTYSQIHYFVKNKSQDSLKEKNNTKNELLAEPFPDEDVPF
jgi:hypothetical protein